MVILEYVIIGTGIAAISALKEILKNRQDNMKITVITEDDYSFYYRPRLIECLSGKVNIDDIIIHDDKWFEKNGVKLLLNEKVVELNPEKEYVKTEKNKISYDKLLLAQGAKPFFPPISGINKDNIFTLRNARDAKTIYQKALSIDKAVVIGCGLLGLESAYNLLQTDIEITMFEIENCILPKQLDREGADILQKILEDKGLNFHTGVMVKKFTGENKVDGVILDNGETIPADMVLLNTGIKANVNFVEEIKELKSDRGIIVNEKMETGLKNIYAAGDVINFEEHFYGHWQPALRQGQTAGSNMVGIKKVFEHQPPEARLKVAGIDVISTGDKKGDNFKINKDPANNRYRKIFLNQNNEIIGAIIVGNYSDNNQIIKEINSKKDEGGVSVMKKYKCSVCGYIYDPEKGDDDGNIEPGIPFDELPEDWVCPVCGVGQDQFEEV